MFNANIVTLKFIHVYSSRPNLKLALFGRSEEGCAHVTDYDTDYHVVAAGDASHSGRSHRSEPLSGRKPHSGRSSERPRDGATVGVNDREP